MAPRLDFGKVWGEFGEGFEDIFGEGLDRLWGGAIDQNVATGFGLIFGSKMTFGGQNGAGMFKKCLGTFV